MSVPLLIDKFFSFPPGDFLSPTICIGNEMPFLGFRQKVSFALILFFPPSRTLFFFVLAARRIAESFIFWCDGLPFPHPWS